MLFTLVWQPAVLSYYYSLKTYLVGFLCFTSCVGLLYFVPLWR